MTDTQMTLDAAAVADAPMPAADPDIVLAELDQSLDAATSTATDGDGRQRSTLTNSPFRYPGGKFYARGLILKELPPHDAYCEPFVGGASIYFAKSTVGRSTLNDLDTAVITTLRVIRDRVEDLITLLDGVPATKEQHRYFKLEYTPTNALEAAFRWYYLNRTSYSGIMKPENCYWGYGEKYSMRVENWPRHLRTCSDKLQHAELTSYDSEVVIDSLPSGSFAFVDPPYFSADQDKFYNCCFSLEDHHRLAACLQRNASRLKFLLTYDNQPEVRKLYDWAEHIYSRSWNYTIARTDDQRTGAKLADGHRGKRDQGREVFIRNYDVD